MKCNDGRDGYESRARFSYYAYYNLPLEMVRRSSSLEVDANQVCAWYEFLSGTETLGIT